MTQTTRFFQGSLWTIGMRWAIRSVGFVSTLILARVLTPADFGILAMSSLITGLLGVCLEMGTWQLLLRMGQADHKAYDTAWTIGLIQAILMTAIVFLAAYPAALYFNEPRLVAVMQILAAGSALNGLVNIGITMWRRDLDFRSDFAYEFITKVVGTIPTVILAVIFRSYWALVAGMIIANALTVVISYVMHPYRPRLSLVYWRRFLSFSLWITPSSIANYLNRRADVFAVGFVANTTQMGAYHVAAELSRMATAEVVIPMGRALYPNYAKIKDDVVELTKAFMIVLHTVSILSFGFGFGMAAVGEDVVYLVLGDQWGFAVPLMLWLSIFGAFSALQSVVTGHILIVLNKERALFFINWARLCVFSASMLLAAHFGDVVHIAMAAAISTAASTLACVFYLPIILRVSAANILLDILRVFLAGLAMFAVIKLQHMDQIESRFMTLMIDTTIGSAVFVAILYLSWLATGRPDGPERRMVNFTAHRLRRLADRS